MLYSFRIEQAIRAATILHKDQVRKGSAPIPYVSHAFATAIILNDYSDDEDLFIAALLHDTLEDTDYTPEELQDDFGGRVKDLVESISEYTNQSEIAQSWTENKERYIVKLKKADSDACLIAAADKIHNWRSIIEEYYSNPTQYLADFGGTTDNRRTVYKKIHDIIESNVTNPIIHEFNHVYEEYLEFLTRIDKEREKEFSL